MNTIRWFYKVAHWSESAGPLSHILDEHGKDGWELVAVLDRRNAVGWAVDLVFKSPGPTLFNRDVFQ